MLGRSEFVATLAPLVILAALWELLRALRAVNLRPLSFTPTMLSRLRIRSGRRRFRGRSRA